MVRVWIAADHFQVTAIEQPSSKQPTMRARVLESKQFILGYYAKAALASQKQKCAF
jgi:hypothetical protein